MKNVFFVSLILVLLAAAFIAGKLTSRSADGDDKASAGRKILYYVDPMNPSHTSDKPGLAPCGMKMEPVYADEAGQGAETGPMQPGTVRLNLQKQQLIGLGTGKVEKKAVSHTLRLLGRVEPDATRSFQVTAPAEGWITKAMPITVGARVRKDETLALLHSPTFISAGVAFRNALEYQDRMKTNEVERALQRPGLAEFNVKQYAESLKNLGVSERQINDMISTRKYSEHIEVVAPATGIMTLRSVSVGQRFEKGAELYRVVDLSKVWVIADVFNRDAPLVPPGVQATIKLPAQNISLPARLSDSLPTFDNVSRTLKLRFEAENPDLLLKPDMFVDVEFDITMPETLVAPADAVLDSGMRKVVFVDRGNGYFEPRVVQTGWRIGDYVQISHGLMQDEPIVTSGNFLLDSESRMKLAAMGVHGSPETDPVCGMAVDEKKARAEKLIGVHEGKTWFFCNSECLKEFEANPPKFIAGRASEQPGDKAIPEEKALDAVCGMTVTQAKAREAGRTFEHAGKTWFFCNDSCKDEFSKDPSRFSQPSTTAHGQ